METLFLIGILLIHESYQIRTPIPAMQLDVNLTRSGLVFNDSYQTPSKLECAGQCSMKTECQVWSYDSEAGTCDTGYINHLSLATNASDQIQAGFKGSATKISCLNKGWSLTPSLDKGFKYFGEIRILWATARTQCENDGGLLAIVRSEEDRQAVEHMGIDQEFFIGLWNAGLQGCKNETCNGVLEWVDEVPFQFDGTLVNADYIVSNEICVRMIPETFSMDDITCNAPPRTPGKAPANSPEN